MGRHNQTNPYSDTATKRSLKADFRYNGWTLFMFGHGCQCWPVNTPRSKRGGVMHGEDGDPIAAAYRLRQRLKDSGIWSFAGRIAQASHSQQQEAAK